MKLKPGISRFNYFFNQLQPTLTTAARQKNPALWLYRNDARTPLFMLEALAKMYSGFHNKKRFTKANEHFKLLEDALGSIDYYDSLAQSLVNNKKIPAPIITYLQAQSREKIQRLNEILVEKEWLLPQGNRIIKIQEKLEDANWLQEEEEVEMLKEFYGESIYEIVEFAREADYHFTDMEEQVHELRRKLRWLSIYPHAVRGAIQFGKSKVRPKHLAKYCSKEITASPFNKMPDVHGAKYTLLLEQDYFYSLSWMIAELGRLKDSGLEIMGLKEALVQHSAISDEEALKRTVQMLGRSHPRIGALLESAGNTGKVYFKEHNLEHLVIGVNAPR